MTIFLQDEVEQAFYHLKESTQELAQAKQIVADTEQALFITKNDLLVQGEITGKNQAERDADLATKTADIRKQLHDDKALMAHRQTKFDLAKMSVKRIELLVRVMEFEQKEAI